MTLPQFLGQCTSVRAAASLAGSRNNGCLTLCRYLGKFQLLVEGLLEEDDDLALSADTLGG